MRFKARARINAFLDEGNREEIGANFEPHDVLHFKDLKRYKERYTSAQKATGERMLLLLRKAL